MHTKCTLRHRTEDGSVGSIDAVELDVSFAQTMQLRGRTKEDPSFHNDERNANARRLVACWNACNGIDLEYLEGDDSLPHFARRMMEQRDDLLNALKNAREMVEDWGSYASPYFQGKHDFTGDLTKLDSAIDAVRGV